MDAHNAIEKMWLNLLVSSRFDSKRLAQQIDDLAHDVIADKSLYSDLISLAKSIDSNSESEGLNAIMQQLLDVVGALLDAPETEPETTETESDESQSIPIDTPEINICDGMPAEVVEIFCNEVQDNLNSLENDLLALEESAADNNHINAAFRRLHTIKGSASVMECGPIAHLAHAAEDVVVAARNRSLIFENELDALLVAIDLCRELNQLLRDSAHSDALPVACPPTYPSVLDYLTQVGLEAMTLPVASETQTNTPVPETPTQTHKVEVKVEPEVELSKNPADSDMLTGLDSKVAAPPSEVTELENQTPETEQLNLIGETSGPANSRLNTDAESSRTFTVPSRDQQANDRHIRVETTSFDKFLVDLQDLIISHRRIAQQLENLSVPTQLLEDFKRQQRDLARCNEAALELRLVPISDSLSGLRRFVREQSKILDKQVQLTLEGVDTRVDRAYVAGLRELILQMTKNALDHGIEPAAQRRELGKPETGTITISSLQRHGKAQIIFEDDGRGLNVAVLREKALARGLISEEDEVDHTIVFAPGFSTRAEAGHLSGRGVGLDLVKKQIEELGGQVNLESEQNRFLRITLELPLRTSLIRAVVVRNDEQAFLVPADWIKSIRRPLAKECRFVQEGTCVIRDGDQSIPWFCLSYALSRQKQAETKPPHEQTALVIQGQNRLFALGIDEVLEQGSYLLKPIEASNHLSPFFDGVSFLESGELALLIQPFVLFDQTRRELDRRKSLNSAADSPPITDND